ncbi:MAG: carboxypeptidase regulatory-like domain-containing protein [Acidobacteria bacterium]|nr:carboxypeptidase regulatory-like domain-containing protein [Acidobacteriota bacterium]
MKNSLCFVFAASLFAQQQQQQGGRAGAQAQAAAPVTGTASIAGKILDPASGTPVKRAVVTVEGETRQARTAKAMSGDDGSYVVKDLPKGKYWITAEKTGYLRGSYRGRTSGGYGDPVEVADGAAKSGIDISLPRQGVIAGRVIDEAGEPVERAMVQAVPLRKTGGRGASASANTNDLGEFRLTKLPPGNYRIVASRMQDRAQILVDRVPGKTAMAEAPTYFPGTTDAASATPVRVNAGEERTGAEIRLQRSTVVRVAGRVAGDLPAGNRGARISLRVTGDMAGFRGGFMAGNDSPVRQDGSFEFQNVRPGEYALTVTSMDRGGPKTMGRQTIVVGQQDMLGVSVTAATPPKVDGRVRADGEPPFAFGKVDITLQPSGTVREFGPPATAKTDDNGGFSFPAVSRERQTISVKASAGVIVKAVYAAGQPLPGLDVDFSVVTGPLEIVLSNKPATITGTVEGTSPDAPRVAVWAVPDGEPLTIEAWSTKKVRVPSDSPVFTLDSLRPGSYRIAAFEDVESDALNDPGLWEQFKARTAAVKVGEGESATVKVRLIEARETEGR